MRLNPTSFLPHLKGLRFDQIEIAERRITLTVTAVRTTAACPLCQHRSKTVHSSYTRTVADLPWSGMMVSLRVRTRRFACPVESCERKIFCERLTQSVRRLRTADGQRARGAPAHRPCAWWESGRTVGASPKHRRESHDAAAPTPRRPCRGDTSATRHRYRRLEPPPWAALR